MEPDNVSVADFWNKVLAPLQNRAPVPPLPVWRAIGEGSFFLLLFPPLFQVVSKNQGNPTPKIGKSYFLLQNMNVSEDSDTRALLC